jgi:hypothetical protein
LTTLHKSKNKEAPLRIVAGLIIREFARILKIKGNASHCCGSDHSRVCPHSKNKRQRFALMWAVLPRQRINANAVTTLYYGTSSRLS